MARPMDPAPCSLMVWPMGFASWALGPWALYLEVPGPMAPLFPWYPLYISFPGYIIDTAI